MAAFLEFQPTRCWKLTITSVETVGENARTTVTYMVEGPDEDGCPPTSQAYHVVAIPQRDTALAFVRLDAP